MRNIVYKFVACLAFISSPGLLAEPLSLKNTQFIPSVNLGLGVQEVGVGNVTEKIVASDIALEVHGVFSDRFHLGLGAGFIGDLSNFEAQNSYWYLKAVDARYRLFDQLYFGAYAGGQMSNRYHTAFGLLYGGYLRYEFSEHWSLSGEYRSTSNDADDNLSRPPGESNLRDYDMLQLRVGYSF
ncbi:outer membrane beta-barrel protein [Agarivorans sp. Alg241-V36]|uniref:outer membrane beta-barrel protein n=1 Tax=Agarivorans sp. Alg241-V36 TaxID=2305992 RepID=UPI0013D028C7|nr:outer membrane beta-barrel protein [Agarivorans sp. Alg241-V36]